MDAVKIATMSLYTTDACPNNWLQRVDQHEGLTKDVEVLKLMESDLEEFEKIAVIFLLAAEYPNSYDTVLGLCMNMQNRPCIISEYMQKNSGIEAEKLIEALCIIGNHSVLTNLGYSKPSEISAKYHACVSRYAVKVNPAVKVLYKLFESMDAEKTELFLRSVYEGSRITRRLDTRYLEIHALHWLHEKYITIALDGTANLANLLKHLKPLGFYTETIYQDVEHFGGSSIPSPRALNADDSCLPAKQMLETRKEPPPVRNDAHVEADIPEKTIQKGLCLIINEVNYKSAIVRYNNRDGSNRDRDNLNETFTRRNFDVRIKENLSKSEMQEFLKEVCENFDVPKYDCLVVCILSHGYEGGIVTCDGLQISNKHIEYLICTNRLCNVIKLLIVQACQGDRLGDISKDADLTTDSCRETGSAVTDSSESGLSTDGPTEKLQPYNHFFRFMSTMDRFLSIRHIKEGTWFIEAVCQELSKSERISIPDWELAVQANVQRRVGFVDGLRTAAQLPECTRRLPVKVYFPPYVRP